MGSKKQNILIIMTDQHSLNGLGCYGADVCRTLNIDSLCGHIGAYGFNHRNAQADA